MEQVLIIRRYGGPGSGHHGHAGRPGVVGGSGVVGAEGSKLSGGVSTAIQQDHKRLLHGSKNLFWVDANTGDVYTHQNWEKALSSKDPVYFHSHLPTNWKERPNHKEDTFSVGDLQGMQLEMKRGRIYKWGVITSPKTFDLISVTDKTDMSFIKLTRNKLEQMAGGTKTARGVLSDSRNKLRNFCEKYKLDFKEDLPINLTFNQRQITIIRCYGGPGSGYMGHKGRPGVVGGSSAFMSVAKNDVAKIAKERGIYVPPAWTDVRFSVDPKAALQVKGKDAKGKTQSVYTAEHSQKAAAEKFERLKDFHKDYSKLKTRIDKDFDTSQEAKVLTLVDATGLRIGSGKETKAAKKAYGASTLEKRHVKIKGDRITLEFTGKKAVEIKTSFQNKKLADYISKRGEGRLFDTSYGKIRSYLKKIDGNFQPKDFRAYKGTMEALKEIKKIRGTMKKNKAIAHVSKHVAKILGNTPGMAKKAYIAPEVWDKLGDVKNLSNITIIRKYGGPGSGHHGHSGRPGVVGGSGGGKGVLPPTRNKMIEELIYRNKKSVTEEGINILEERLLGLTDIELQTRFTNMLKKNNLVWYDGVVMSVERMNKLKEIEET